MIDHPVIVRLARPATWACVVVLANLSLLPKEEMIRTGADGRFEHFIAYAGTMVVGAVGYGPRHGVWPIAIMLIVYAGLMELGQNFTSGRTPAVADFAAGALGALVAALLYVRLARR